MFKKVNLIILLLIIIMFPITTFAATTAYSVGVTYPGPGSHYSGAYESDTTAGLATTAANGYYPHNSLTASYYNHDVNYSYLNSASRFGGSRIFFIAGHADSTKMLLASRNNNSEYVTGIIINGTNPNQLGEWKLVVLQSRSFSSTRIISFVGCKTAEKSPNLLEVAINKGASAALGFNNFLNLHYAPNITWLKEYNYAIGRGNSILQAKNYADSIINNETAWYSVIKGAGATTLRMPSEQSLMKSNVSDMVFAQKAKIINPDFDIDTYMRLGKPFDDIYQSVSKKNIKLYLPKENFIEENLNENSFITINEIVEEVKKYDENFKEKDYKVSYQLDKESGYGWIKLIYYIDGKIKTNKIYTAFIENKEVVKINLTNIFKKNLNKIGSIDEKELIKKVLDFDYNIKEKHLLTVIDHTKIKTKSILNDNKLLNISNLNDITEFREDYEYDYNTRLLTYYLSLINDNEEIGVVNGYSIEI